MTSTASLRPELLALLVCPQDKEPLWFFPEQGVLYNDRLRCLYEVRQDIPVLLADEARTVDEDEHANLMTLTERDKAVRTGSRN